MKISNKRLSAQNTLVFELSLYRPVLLYIVRLPYMVQNGTDTLLGTVRYLIAPTAYL
jgi:hypothetical protein